MAALLDGEAGLEQFGLQVGQGVQPMLAQSATTVAEAMAKTGTPAAIEWKLDGIRIQAHRDGDEVVVYTRTLDDITGRSPEVVAALRALPCERVVLDGELIALRDDGRPHPFQVTGSRTMTALRHRCRRRCRSRRTSSTSCTWTATTCSGSTAPPGTSG